MLHNILVVIASVVLGAIVIIIAEAIVPLAVDIFVIWMLRLREFLRRDKSDKD